MKFWVRQRHCGSLMIKRYINIRFTYYSGHVRFYGQFVPVRRT